MNQGGSLKGVVTEKVLNFVDFKNFGATKDASESQTRIGIFFAEKMRKARHGNQSQGRKSMQSKAILMGLFAMVFLSFALPGSAEAKKGSKGGHGGGSEKVKLEAELEPCCNTPEPGAEGESERRSKTKDGVSKEERFKAEVEIPFPNALGIDQSNAQSADIRLILSRAGTNYAECLLVFDEIENDDGEVEVEYKLDLKIKEDGKQKSRGSCDVGMPDVVDGDLATAVLVVNPLDRTQDIALLEGTFELDD
jgi:hypothetical protein